MSGRRERERERARDALKEWRRGVHLQQTQYMDQAITGKGIQLLQNHRPLK